MPITIVNDILAANDNFNKEKLCSFKISADILVCALTNQKLIDPVVASDGYTYEKNAIQEWFKQRTFKDFVKSPVESCDNILETDNSQQLILHPNLLAKYLLVQDGNATIDIEHSAFIDKISLLPISNNPIIFPNGLTYDLASKSKWIKKNAKLIAELAKEFRPLTVFKNNLAAKILESFAQEYAGIHNIDHLETREFFHKVQLGKIIGNFDAAKNFVNNNPHLVTRKINKKGAQIIHILAALNNIEMVDFLITTHKVSPYSIDNNAHAVLFYACTSQDPEMLKYFAYKTRVSLNLQTQSHNIDALVFALSFERQEIISELFKLGFKINTNNEQYILTIGNILSTKNFVIISLIIDQLENQGELNKVAHQLFNLIILAQNCLISADNFKKIFNILNNCATQPDFNKFNPYILGVMHKNLNYLQGFNAFKLWRKYIDRESLINKKDPAQGNLDCLQFATSLGSAKLIKLLLAYGAKPDLYDNRVPFNLALLALTKYTDEFDTTTTYTILNYLLNADLRNLTTGNIYALFVNCPKQNLLDFLTAKNYAVIKKIEAIRPGVNPCLMTNHKKISLAYHLLATNKLPFFMVDLKIKKVNVLHACISSNNPDLMNFNKHLIDAYPQLILQQDILARTPLDYALKQASLELIQFILAKIHELITKDYAFKDFNAKGIIIKSAFKGNPNLSPEDQENLTNWIKEIFKLEKSSQKLTM